MPPWKQSNRETHPDQPGGFLSFRPYPHQVVGEVSPLLLVPSHLLPCQVAIFAARTLSFPVCIPGGVAWDTSAFCHHRSQHTRARGGLWAVGCPSAPPAPGRREPAQPHREESDGEGGERSSATATHHGSPRGWRERAAAQQ